MTPLLAPGQAYGQAFDETTVSFSFADDDVFRDSGETRKNSPEAFFGGQAQSPADRFAESVFSKTGSRLVVSKKFEVGKLVPEGGLRFRAIPNMDGVYGFFDDGTWLSLGYVPSSDTAAKLTLYPLDSDRLRIGYNWDVTWGGTNVFPKNFRTGLAPGAKVSYETGPLTLFAGMKTTLIRSPSERVLDNPGGNTNQYVQRSYYGVLGGAELDLPLGLTLRGSGGYFQKGTNNSPNVLGKPIPSGGGSAQVAWHTGAEVGRRMDLRLYFANPEEYTLETPTEGHTGLDLALEGAYLVQTLEDTDRYASTKNEFSKALALTAGLRYGRTRFFFDAVYRDLSYVVFNVPGFEPYKALSDSADLTHSGSFSFIPEALSGEWFGLLSVDHFFGLPQSLGLTPALSIGTLLPATYMPGDEGLTIEGPFGEEHALGRQRVVVRGTRSTDWEILPPGENELPLLILRGDVKFTVGEHFSLVGEVSYINDRNFSQVEQDPQGHALRKFVDPNILGVGLVSELKF